MYRPADTPIEAAEKPPADLAELPLEHLEHELCELASHLGAGMARWIALVDEYDRREGWGKWWGVKSTAHWISWQCACSLRTAREHVRVAHALRDLPITREAFSHGELSYAKVRALTRVATPESEELPEPLLDNTVDNADALSVICESFLATGPRERAGPLRRHVVVHVDAKTLANDAPGRSELEHGPAISPELARRLGCDAQVQVLVKRGRKALYLGRKTRSILPALSLALHERDRGCRFPGCNNTRWVDGHHIIPWALGGRTDLDNLVLLCRHHHRLVHEGGFALSGNASCELVFRNPRGDRLDNSPEPPPGSLPRLISRNRDVALAIGPETLVKGDGERMDLDECVYAVAKAIDAPRSQAGSPAAKVMA